MIIRGVHHVPCVLHPLLSVQLLSISKVLLLDNRNQWRGSDRTYLELNGRQALEVNIIFAICTIRMAFFPATPAQSPRKQE